MGEGGEELGCCLLEGLETGSIVRLSVGSWGAGGETFIWDGMTGRAGRVLSRRTFRSRL